MAEADLRPLDFIDLDRRFVPHDERRANGEEDLWAEFIAAREETRDWDWLLGYRVVALLAEAGSGKTYEFLNQAQRLEVLGKVAIYLRIERLCRGSIEDAFETVPQSTAFRAWLGGTGDAVFFLDSVDEAKLPHGDAEPLRDALAALERAIQRNLHRIRVIVSCRGSEWYSDTEQAHIERFAKRLANARGGAGKEVDDAKLLRNLSFAPLDRDRVRKIALRENEDEDVAANAFLVGLDEQQLWEEVRTPMDAVHYAALFAEAAGDPVKLSQLSSRSAVLETSVIRRLADRADSRSRIDLSPQAALMAARFLAFATVVLQNRDLSFEQPVTGALDVRTLLAEGPAALSGKLVRQLLATPLFTPAGRGCVRFYRPETEAMLAAQFLEYLSRLTPPRRMLAEFSRTQFGLEFVPYAFGPMLAWLAARDPVVLRHLAIVAPELIIEEGDPRAIAVGERVAALIRHVTVTYENLSGHFFPNTALARFAEPALETAIVGLAMSAPQNEAQLHLLQLVRMGRYRSATDWLEQICGDGFTPADVRAYAVRAIIVCGDDDNLRRVAARWLAWGQPIYPTQGRSFDAEREDDARINFIASAYPRAISLGTTLQLLAQVRGREFPRDKELFVALAERAPAADLPGLVDGLERLSWTSRPDRHFGHRAPDLSGRASLLFGGLSAAIARCIEHRPDEVRIESIDWCYTGGRYTRLDRDRDEWKNVSQALARLPGVRARLIRAAIAATRTTHPLIGLADRLIAVWQADAGALDDDISVALAGYCGADIADRPRWADLLMRWMCPMSRSAHLRLRVKLARAAFAHRAGRDWATLSTVRPRPFGRLTARWRRVRHDNWWQLRHWVREQHEGLADRLQLGKLVLRSWRKLGEGRAPMLAAGLLFEQSYDPVDESAVVERFGRLLGRQLVKAAQRWAATVAPGIRYRHEIEALTETGLRWLHRRDPAFARQLGSDAKRAAIEHQLRDIDDSGPWAEAIARDDEVFWAGAAADVVIESMRARACHEPEHTNVPLAKLQRLPVDLQALVAPALLAWAQGCTTMCAADIAALADVVSTEPMLQCQLDSLAERGTREAIYEGQWNRALEWLRIWGRRDARAIELYCDWFERVWRGQPAVERRALKALAGMLGGGWERQQARIADLPAALRLRLGVLVHDAVKLADDEPRSDGVRTLTSRDQEEETRRLVDNYLDADKSDAGRAALLQFIQVVIEPVHPMWARRWRAAHARSAAVPAPWSMEQLRLFVEHGAAPPRNGDELLARVIEEIKDIETSLVSGEFDRRTLFKTGLWETHFRGWLGYELDRRIRSWAAITQETVTRGEKRTDLRVELRGGDHAVLVVEIKLAHRWPQAELVEKLQRQLVDQYLIGDPRVRHGLYLLVDLGGLLRRTPPVLAADAQALMAHVEAQAVAVTFPGANQVRAMLFTVSVGT